MHIPLSLKRYIHNITKRLRTVDEVEHYFPGFISFIDATEQQIPRPVDKRRRDAHYSGKKKRHIVKTQLMVNKEGKRLYKSNHHKKGRQHDYTVYKKEQPQTPSQVENVLDLGY